MNQQTFYINTPTGRLEAEAIWRTAADTTADYLALICHPNPLAGGDMNNKVVSTMYRFCRDAGMSVLRFNYRGVGGSDSVSEYGEGEFIDTLNVLRFMRSQTNARKLWLGGFSFGGFIACRVADRIRQDVETGGEFADIVLSDLALIAPSIVKNDTSTLSWQAANTYLIYGSQDEMVPADVMAAFAADRDMPSTVVDTGHFFHTKLTELKLALQQHFIAAKNNS